MAQGQRLTDWQIETIRGAWLLTENGSEAARQAGCAVSTGNAYVKAHLSELRQLRKEKTPELAEVVRALLDRTLTVAFDGKKLNDASFGQVMTGVGILIDKYQLLTGGATERHEHLDADSPRDQLARRIDELTERRRAKAPAEPTHGSASG